MLLLPLQKTFLPRLWPGPRGQSGWSSLPSQVCFQFCENPLLRAPVRRPGAGFSGDKPQARGKAEPQRVYLAFPGCGPSSHPLSPLSERVWNSAGPSERWVSKRRPSPYQAGAVCAQLGPCFLNTEGPALSRCCQRLLSQAHFLSSKRAGNRLRPFLPTEGLGREARGPTGSGKKLGLVGWAGHPSALPFSRAPLPAVCSWGHLPHDQSRPCSPSSAGTHLARTPPGVQRLERRREVKSSL